MINWPQKSFKALVKLFEPLQDIDVYVEDAQDEIFYTHLLTRVAGSEIRIARVFSPPEKGGRSTVIAAAKIHDHSKRRALFLIDGDLDFTRGDPPPMGIRGLYRLDAYCIENYLFCARAATNILLEEAMLSEEEAEKKLDFANWYGQIQTPLIRLFSAFSLINAVLPSYATVSIGVGVYCQQVGKSTMLSEAKVNSAVEVISALVADHITAPIAAKRFEGIQDRAIGLPNTVAVVSGKDFLLPLLAFRLSSLGCKVSKDRLRFKLALKCDITRLAPLLGEMSAVAKS